MYQNSIVHLGEEKTGQQLSGFWMRKACTAYSKSAVHVIAMGRYRTIDFARSNDVERMGI